jgi:lysophospholipase L1-like esterase
MHGAEGLGPASVPEAREEARHAEFLVTARSGGIELLFVGDSITDFWRKDGATYWNEVFAPLKAANFGVSGDTTNNVLWRLQHGELDRLQPRAVVVLIGTNNKQEPAEIAEGIGSVVEEIRKRCPNARVILHGLLPRGDRPDGITRSAAVNLLLKPLIRQADPGRLVLVDAGAVFLKSDGSVNPTLMPDLLHPGPDGYRRWGQAFADIIKSEMSCGNLGMPVFANRSSIPAVAKAEMIITAGGIANGLALLQRLTRDPAPATATAAQQDLEVVSSWKVQMDAELEAMEAKGDIYCAFQLADRLAKVYSGVESKSYREKSNQLKRDPGYAIGREYQALLALPFGARRNPQFIARVRQLATKAGTGWYSESIRALLQQ